MIMRYTEIDALKLLFSKLVSSRQEYDFQPPALVSHVQEYAHQPDRLRRYAKQVIFRADYDTVSFQPHDYSGLIGNIPAGL